MSLRHRLLSAACEASTSPAICRVPASAYATVKGRKAPHPDKVRLTIRVTDSVGNEVQIEMEDGFRPLASYRPDSTDLQHEKGRGDKRRVFMQEPDTRELPHRSNRMPLNQDWTAVWPTAASFKHGTVPLPVRMGYKALRDTPPPDKFNNLELIKIPNFLHLTPEHIKKHCDAIKKFTTPWPSGLQTEEDCKQHYPVKVVTNSYVHSGGSIRDERARHVTVNVPLESLNLDKRAREKLLRLVGPSRYDEQTDLLSIEADRCPTKQQNTDYAMYLLTALYHESKKEEAWEREQRRLEDESDYAYEKSPVRRRVREHVKDVDEKAESEYVSAWHAIRSTPEPSEQMWREYGERTAKLYGLKPAEV